MMIKKQVYNILNKQGNQLIKFIEEHISATGQRVQQLLQDPTVQGSSQSSFDLLLRMQLKAPIWEKDTEFVNSLVFPPAGRLGDVAERFKLNEFEVNVLLVSLLPFLNSNASDLFACLNTDERARWPIAETMLNLFSCNEVDKINNRICLQADSTLVYHGLVDIVAVEYLNGSQLEIRGVLPVFNYLVGLENQTHTAAESYWLSTPTIKDILPEFTDQLSYYCLNIESSRVIAIEGREGDGRKAALARAASKVAKKVLLIDLDQYPENAETARKLFVSNVREVSLYGGCLLVQGLSDYCERHPPMKTWISRCLENQHIPIFILADNNAPLVWLENISQVAISIPVAKVDDEIAMLNNSLEAYPIDQEIDSAAIVRRYSIEQDTLAKVLKEADDYRRRRGVDASINNNDLRLAFGKRSQQAFGKLAKRIEPIRTFDDLVISASLKRQLEELLAAIKYRDNVLERGFKRKIGYGSGISALFHGDSGTGKTMVAEVLAKELGVDLIKIDLSTVVNKYIGETEKNLSKIFDYAEADSGLLFFDEADALFGKRSETKDSHDRYANIEVSYLLQRLENYPGLVVMATNNRSNLDEAFTRRLTFIIRFPFPDMQLREEMWRRIWPADIQLADEVCFESLAKRADITGASIRNIALLASWLAADSNDDKIFNDHIERALRRELTKQGRVATNGTKII